MLVIEGLCGIKAQVVCDSISEQDVRLTTMLVDYPRIVHAEQLKHRMFSTSAASSRAIPFAKMQEQLTGMPVRFGANQPGMQDGGKHDGLISDRPFNIERDCFSHCAEDAWEIAKEEAQFWSQAFSDAGYHKQICNRLTEPFQMIRVLITATEWNNFWWLRNDEAADPTLHETARVMKEAYDGSIPQLLKAGEWHLPFIDREIDNAYYQNKESSEEISLDSAIKMSCARCAATSFRNTDYNLEKSLQVYDRLVNGAKIHAGALEHCATPMQKPVFNLGTHMTKKDFINQYDDSSSWEKGISHVDKYGKLWSGNFKGWVQYRKTIAGENHSE